LYIGIFVGVFLLFIIVNENPGFLLILEDVFIFELRCVPFWWIDCFDLMGIFDLIFDLKSALLFVAVFLSDIWSSLLTKFILVSLIFLKSSFKSGILFNKFSDSTFSKFSFGIFEFDFFIIFSEFSIWLLYILLLEIKDLSNEGLLLNFGYEFSEDSCGWSFFTFSLSIESNSFDTSLPTCEKEELSLFSLE